MPQPVSHRICWCTGAFPGVLWPCSKKPGQANGVYPRPRQTGRGVPPGPQDKLNATAQYAAKLARKQQAGYVSRYNLRARHKSFREGDQVIVLAPEAGGKLCNKWQGPGTVVKVMSQNSYLVYLGTNGTRHLHANKMRHFVARVNGCSVNNECDVELGNVITPMPAVVSCDVPSNRIEEVKIAHLQPEQRCELLHLLDEFHDRFGDRPG